MRNLLLISALAIIVFSTAIVFFPQNTLYISVFAGLNSLLSGVIIYVLYQKIYNPIKNLQDIIYNKKPLSNVGESWDSELYKLTKTIKDTRNEHLSEGHQNKTILQSMLIPMAFVRSDQTISWVNQPMLNFLEYDQSPEQFQGQNFSQFFYNEQKDTCTDQTIKNLQTTTLKSEVVSRKGNKKFISIFSTPIFDHKGKLEGAFTSIMDFTRIKEKEDTIIAQNEKIKQASQQAEILADEVNQDSNDIREQVNNSIQITHQQQNLTRETATAMEEMASSILEVSRNAEEASKTADKTKNKAEQGTKVVQSTVNLIQEIQVQSQGLQQEMDKLGQQAEGINNIINVISDIADQTNLLALNAAIEAARAGDAGRGFAVVADEVRKLAEKTMSATQEVEKHISEMQQSVVQNVKMTERTANSIDQGTELSEQSGQALQEILSLVENTSDQIRGIATASEQQSTAGEEINRSTIDIDQTTSQTAQAMEQAARTVQNMIQHADTLHQVIQDMKS